jgi:phenylacetaldehyde dehydrogenase
MPACSPETSPRPTGPPRSYAAGAVWVNTWNVFDASLPLGDYKESGWGREMGPAVFNNYMATKTIITQLS